MKLSEIKSKINRDCLREARYVINQGEGRIALSPTGEVMVYERCYDGEVGHYSKGIRVEDADNCLNDIIDIQDGGNGCSFWGAIDALVTLPPVEEDGARPGQGRKPITWGTYERDPDSRYGLGPKFYGG